MDAQKTA
jgi:hypothetical protein